MRVYLLYLICISVFIRLSYFVYTHVHIHSVQQQHNIATIIIPKLLFYRTCINLITLAIIIIYFFYLIIVSYYYSFQINNANVFLNPIHFNIFFIKLTLKCGQNKALNIITVRYMISVLFCCSIKTDRVMAVVRNLTPHVIHVAI